MQATTSQRIKATNLPRILCKIPQTKDFQERNGMLIKEIVEKIGMSNVYEVRRITDTYGELIFYSKKTDEWSKAFTNILGPAVKPAGVKPTENDLQLTRDYGGIWINQILFRKEIGNVKFIAMFWPWQDNIHTTLKMAFLEKRR
jgi:hypothetical protein